MVSKDIEQEVQVEIEIGLDNDLGTSLEVETRVRIEESDLGMFQEIDQNQSPGLDQATM